MFDKIRKNFRSAQDLADLIPDVLLSRTGLDSKAKYLFESVLEQIHEVEKDKSVDSRGEVYRRLRALGLDDFAYLLWTMPHRKFPRISTLLPRMATAEVQKHWTGRSGIPLLKPTVSFVRIMAYNYSRLRGASIDEHTRILDYGCGYGRIARLMYYFTNEENVVGVDPWDKSIEQCRLADLGTKFVQSDYLPKSLPVGDQRFDLVYAYSVFTHISEDASLAALSAIRKHIKEDGVLAVTVRPVEFWALTRYISEADAIALSEEYRRNGFAFRAHPRNHEHNAVADRIVYGDSTMSRSWFEEKCGDWSVALVDRSLNDRLQNYLFLVPR